MNHLKKLREAKGLSQAKLAELAGTSQPQIKRLENAERELTLTWAEKLAQHLGVTAQQLMFPNDAPPPPDEADDLGSTYPQIGRRLAKLRRALGMEPLEIALELGITPGEWDSYEEGLSLIEIDHISTLMRLMPGITSDWILFGNRSKLTVEVDNALKSGQSAARR